MDNSIEVRQAKVDSYIKEAVGNAVVILYLLHNNQHSMIHIKCHYIQILHQI